MAQYIASDPSTWGFDELGRLHIPVTFHKGSGEDEIIMAPDTFKRLVRELKKGEQS